MITTITIDGAGRVVLPKAVRNRFHLVDGSTLALKIESDAIRLEPDQMKAPMTRVDGILVHQGRATGDLLDAVERSRSRRDEDVSGMSR